MRGIEKLHPELQIIVGNFINKCRESGLNVGITETLRTAAEQDALYAKGRTVKGNIVTHCQGVTLSSPHQWGVAFDICNADNPINPKSGKRDAYYPDAFFKACGQIGKSLGLFWGGDFKSYYDGPHFELKEYLPNNSTKTLKAKYGTPEKFMATWKTAATKPTTMTTMPILRRGDNGEDVEALQHALVKAGYVLNADGDFGTVTYQTVRLFQKREGLEADGVVGKLTWASLGM